MDKALVFGTKDCRLESCQGQFYSPAAARRLQVYKVPHCFVCLWRFVFLEAFHFMQATILEFRLPRQTRFRILRRRAALGLACGAKAYMVEPL